MNEYCFFQATKEFLESVNRAYRRTGPVSWSTAVKFLTARKFDVTRALSLYDQHEATRRREGLAVLHPTQEPLFSELRTGKFTVLVIHSFRRAKQTNFFHHQTSSLLKSKTNFNLLKCIKMLKFCKKTNTVRKCKIIL